MGAKLTEGRGLQIYVSIYIHKYIYTCIYMFRYVEIYFSEYEITYLIWNQTYEIPKTENVGEDKTFICILRYNASKTNEILISVKPYYA